MLTTLEKPPVQASSADYFLSSFVAVADRIRRHSDLHTLTTNLMFTGFNPRITDEQLSSISKLMLNAWSAEYALRITPVVNDEQYLQSSLHWTMPQSFYSVLFSTRAFLALNDQNVSNEELIRHLISRYVVKGFYPNSIGFYASQVPGIRRALEDVITPGEPIAQFVTQTRQMIEKRVFRELQNNPQTALRNARTGEVLTTLTTDRKQLLNKKVGLATIFDVMARLRINTTNRDLEQFAGEIDVRLLHDTLTEITAFINAVHEAYIMKAIGIDRYRVLIIDSMPGYLREGFVRDRFERILQISRQ